MCPEQAYPYPGPWRAIRTGRLEVVVLLTERSVRIEGEVVPRRGLEPPLGYPN